MLAFFVRVSVFVLVRMYICLCRSSLLELFVFPLSSPLCACACVRVCAAVRAMVAFAAASASAAAAAASGSSADGADLWSQLVYETSGRRWADVLEEEDLLEHALADADLRAQVCETTDKHGTWFVCPVCSLQRGTTAWVDNGHWETDRHAKSVRSIRKRIEDKAWRKHQAQANASASAPASYAAPAANHEPWVHVEYPSSHSDGDHIDGAFLVDSFHYFKKPNKKGSKDCLRGQ